MEKIPWDMGRDGVVMAVGWRSDGKKSGRQKDAFLWGAQVGCWD